MGHDVTVNPGPVVFVVDDDISVRESLELLIRTAGWQPETCDSAQAFLARDRVRGPSCLVLDVSLPGLTGLALQQRLGDRADMPIIFITGHGDIPMTVQAMKAGAVEFLTKPFENERLWGAIAGAIERSRSVLDEQGELQALRDRYATLTHREQQVGWTSGSREEPEAPAPSSNRHGGLIAKLSDSRRPASCVAPYCNSPYC
jgi:FixJ family two-component response regulator